MDTYNAVKTRLLRLCDEKRMTIHRLATESAVPPSTIKNVLYGKSRIEFFDSEEFRTLEQELK